MATNYSQGLTAALPVAIETTARAACSTFARMLLWFKQLLCGLHGHDTMLHFEQSRVMLVCASCGHESPGWDLGQRRPRVRFQGDARRHLVAQNAPVFTARRTA
jgi:hypothetical protein